MREPLGDAYDKASAFIERLTGDANTPVTFQVFHDSPSKNAGLARILHGSLKKRFSELQRLNQQGCGIFITPNQTDLKGRKNENITRVRAIPLDDDNGVTTPDSLPLRPHIITSTSPGKQQIIILTDTTDFTAYDGVIERMVKDHGCDPGAKGLTRVVRLPGFYHLKDPRNPHMVEITHMTDDPPHSWKEILKAFPPCSNGGSKEKNKKRESVFQDPVYLHLQANGWVLDANPDGRVHITCPFKSSHTTGDNVSATTYFVAHTNGYRNGHFKCQHGHCAARSDAAFLFAVGYTGAGGEAGPKPFMVPSRKDLEISFDEWVTSPLAPTCIVEHYLYSDVAALVAPGGTGKTTTQLYEANHIVLQKDLYGNKVITPGWVLFITSEDGREILIARLREVSRGMGLTPVEIDVVRRKIAFWDVSERMLKLIHLDNNNVVLAPVVREIVTAYQDDPPVLVVFDPAVSFGIGEDRVNTNEQGLIMAARAIRNGLGCAVRIVHHTGKAVAREKISDQYAGRGGSALADGARMVVVMHPWKPDGTTHPPEGCTPAPEASITILYRPKLSYAPPNLPAIWIRRVGWTFEWFNEICVSDEEQRRGFYRQIVSYIGSEESKGNYPTKKSIEAELMTMGHTRSSTRDAIEILMSENRLIVKPLPKAKQIGFAKDYVGLPNPATRGDTAKNDENPSPEKNQSPVAAALREKPGGDSAAQANPSSLGVSPTCTATRGDTATRSDENDPQEITWDTIL